VVIVRGVGETAHRPGLAHVESKRQRPRYMVESNVTRTAAWSSRRAFTGLCDHTGGLASRGYRRAAPAGRAVEAVHVASADAAGLDADEDLTAGGGGAGAFS